MSIKNTQVVERDTLNRAFVSKSATGTQIMAGSLRLLGGIQVDGAVTLGAISTNAINAGNSSISTTGAISGGTLTGSGAGITSLNASNLTSGTVGTAQLPSTVFYTNTQQTITSNTTMNANLYLANGTSYYLNSSGDGRLRNITGIGTIIGGAFHGIGGHAEDIIRLTGTELYSIGTEAYKMRYGAKASSAADSIGHKFYRGGGELIAEIGQGSAGTPTNRLDSRFHGHVSVAQSLEVEGELKAGGQNEFPDPLIASGSLTAWPLQAGGTITVDMVQKPSGTDAAGSVKIQATSTRGYAYSGKEHEVSPSEWITFSAFAFSTTSGKQGRLTIRWKNSAGTEVGRTDIFYPLGTSWGRYKATGQAPATATKFDVAISSEVSGTIAYWSAFQVERGRAMTAFKPHTGSGTGVSLIGNSLKLGVRGEIVSEHNNAEIVRDHKNGNITLSAAGSNLYLGYVNTKNVFLSSNLTTVGEVKIAGTDGALYYKGDDIDGRYLKLTGGTVTGATSFTGNVVMGGSATMNGGLHVATNSGSHPLFIARHSGTSEGLKIWTEDSATTLHQVNDESASYMSYIMENTDTESGGGAAATTRTMLYMSSTSSSWGVGIGKTSPSQALDVNGSVSISGDLHFNSGILIATGSGMNVDHIWYNDAGANSNSTLGTWNFVSDAAAKTSGNAGLRFGSFYAAGTEHSHVAGALGIGTNTVTAKLTVEGDISSTTGIKTSGNFVTDGGMLEVNAPATTGGWARGLNVNSSDGATRHAAFGVYGSGTGTNWMYMAYGTNAYSSGLGLYVQPNGHVGVGATSPSDKLQIAVPETGTAMTGRAAFGGIHLEQKGPASNFVGITTGSQSSGTQGGILFQGSGGYGTKIHFMTTNSFANGQYTRMTLDHSGNLGIGTESPSYKLDVNGTANISSALTASSVTTSGSITTTGGDIIVSTVNKGIQFAGGGVISQNSATDSWIRMSKGLYMSSHTLRTDGTLQVGSSNGLVVTSTTLDWKGSTIFSDTSGKVSINQDSNSEHPLHVKSNASYMGVNIQSTADTDISGFSLQRSNGYYNWHIARSSVAAADLIFYSGNTDSMSALTERLRITNAGRVGIGVASPSYGLHLNESIGINAGAHALVVSGRNDFANDGQNAHIWTSDGTGTATGFTGLGAHLVIEGRHSTARDIIFKAGTSEKFRIKGGGESEFHGQLLVNGHVSASAGNGRGFRFWNSDSYKIHMSSAGGNLSWVSDADYNMYFEMGSNNRGFAFTNPSQGGVNAQIEGNGRVNSNVGFRAKKFEMAYNETEDSLDFIYHG